MSPTPKRRKIQSSTVNADEIDQLISDEVTKYDKKRIKAINELVVTFFKRHPNQHYTRDTFLPRPYGEQDLYKKWNKIKPTSLELKIVFSSLMNCSFLKRVDNEQYNPNGSNIFRHPGDKCRYKWIHIQNVPDDVANWKW